MTFADRVVAAWYAPRLTPLTVVLWPLSVVFGAVVGLRRALYRAGVLRSVRLPVPVVVVGNITVGRHRQDAADRERSPQALARARLPPGIVEPRLRRDAAWRPRAVAADDDPRERRRRAAAARRATASRCGSGAIASPPRAALAAHPACDVMLADDGLSALSLSRATVEIAVVDASAGWATAACCRPVRCASRACAARRGRCDRGALIAGDAPRTPAATDARTRDALRAAAMAQSRGPCTRGRAVRGHRAAERARGRRHRRIRQRFFALLRAHGHRGDRAIRFPIITASRAAISRFPARTRS